MNNKSISLSELKSEHSVIDQKHLKNIKGGDSPVVYATEEFEQVENTEVASS